MVDMNVVDSPIDLAALRNGEEPRDITLDDVNAAFEWAKAKGTLDQPLLFIFIDHGLTDGLRLDPFDEILTSSNLKSMLDDYQQATGNQVVVILEACHSGTLVQGISGNNRIVITSADENNAYYDNLGSLSFSKFYFDALRRGESFYNAFTYISDKLPSYGTPFSNQTPQLEDNGDGVANTSKDGIFADTLCLNGCFGGLAGEITLEPQTESRQVSQGETAELCVKAGITEGGIKKVWAVILTPESANQRDEQGYSLIQSPVVYLSKSENSLWSGKFSDFYYNGDYKVTFMAEDQDGFIASSLPVVFTLSDGQDFSSGDTTQETSVKLNFNQSVYGGGDQFKLDIVLNGNETVDYFLSRQ